MEKYELMYIISADLDEASRKAEIEKLHKILTDNKAVIRDVKEWGVREFASPIHKLTKGYYVVLKLDGEHAGLLEFERLARLDNQVIRFLLTVDKD
ncbi:MAG: 30S ribosomal protein S6 [Bacilli bacterium]|jgi:small subunit ribosomal protein S6|nr:30S ribosomal protein S6 [Bacilli bacterium]